MSPTEFAIYIKQRAHMQQQQMQLQQHGQQGNTAAVSPPQLKSFGDTNGTNFYAPHNNYSFRNNSIDTGHALDSLNRFSTTFVDDGPSQFFNQNVGLLSPVGTVPQIGSVKGDQDKNFFENLNFAFNSPSPSSTYQHLLLAN